MNKQTLIIVHGMGDHTDESFKKEVVDTLNKALGRYDSYKNKKIEEEVNIVPVSYNDVFEKHRKEMADNAKEIKDRFSIPLSDSFLGKLISFDKEFGRDEFFYSHWLDVLFYKTIIGEHIKIKVAKKISKTISKVNSENVHIMGHSLGTVVVHDALNALYRKQFEPDDLVTPLENDNTIDSIWMVANVSQALERPSIPVINSVVKPGKEGCCNVFTEVRHRLDPITKVRPFNPLQNGAWIPNRNWGQYSLIKISAMTDLDTHSIKSYLSDPQVYIPLLEGLIEFKVDEKEADKGIESFTEETLKEKALIFRDKFNELSILDGDSIKALIQAGKGLRGIMQDIKGDLK